MARPRATQLSTLPGFMYFDNPHSVVPLSVASFFFWRCFSPILPPDACEKNPPKLRTTCFTPGKRPTSLTATTTLCTTTRSLRASISRSTRTLASNLGLTFPASKSAMMVCYVFRRWTEQRRMHASVPDKQNEKVANFPDKYLTSCTHRPNNNPARSSFRMFNMKIRCTLRYRVYATLLQAWMCTRETFFHAPDHRQLLYCRPKPRCLPLLLMFPVSK